MAYRLVGAKPLSEPMLDYCSLDPKEQTSVKFQSKSLHFHLKKCAWKCLRNGVHFVSTSMRQFSNHPESIGARPACYMTQFACRHISHHKDYKSPRNDSLNHSIMVVVGGHPLCWNLNSFVVLIPQWRLAKAHVPIEWMDTTNQNSRFGTNVNIAYLTHTVISFYAILPFLQKFMCTKSQN